MKIIRDNAVYVQRNDIGFLNQTDLEIPVSIYLKVFGNGIVVIDARNRFEFVRFDEESEIKFFKEQNWIIDYDTIKDLDESQIIDLGQKIADEKNKIANEYNSMTEDEQFKNENMIFECEKLDYMIYSLVNIYWFKQGNLHFDLPDCIELPKINEKKEKGFMKILNKFKRK